MMNIRLRQIFDSSPVDLKKPNGLLGLISIVALSVILDSSRSVVSTRVTSCSCKRKSADMSCRLFHFQTSSTSDESSLIPIKSWCFSSQPPCRSHIISSYFQQVSRNFDRQKPMTSVLACLIPMMESRSWNSCWAKIFIDRIALLLAIPTISSGITGTFCALNFDSRSASSSPEPTRIVCHSFEPAFLELFCSPELVWSAMMAARLSEHMLVVPSWRGPIEASAHNT